MAVLAAAKKSTNVLYFLRLLSLRLGFRLGGWLMPTTALLHAFRLFGTPLPGGRRRAGDSDGAGARIETLAFGSQQVAIYRWGDARTQPVALLAHGWSGYGLFFLPWVEPLRRAGYAVVAFDQIAHGRSGGQRTTLPMFAEVMRRVAGHAGPPAALIAHSMGGAAATLALAGGMPAGRVVLIAPSADPVAAARRFGGLIGLATHLTERLFDEYEAVTGIAPGSLQAHVNAPSIATPALIVHDVEDREVPWSEGERYARYWPGARLLTTSGLGHYRIANDAGVIAEALRFLRGEAVGERVVSTRELPYGCF